MTHHEHSRYMWLQRKMQENREEERRLKGSPMGAIELHSRVYPEYQILANERRFLDEVLSHIPMDMVYVDGNNANHADITAKFIARPLKDIVYPVNTMVGVEGGFTYSLHAINHADHAHTYRMSKSIAIDIWHNFLRANPEFQEHVIGVTFAERFAPLAAASFDGAYIFTMDDAVSRFPKVAEHREIIEYYIKQAISQPDGALNGWKLHFDWYPEDIAK